MIFFEIIAAGFAGFVWWSWIVFAVLGALLLGSVHEARDGDWGDMLWASVITAVFLGFMLSMADSVAHINFSFASILASVLTYTVLGIIWAFFKWTRVIITEAKAGRQKPTAERYKSRITSWIAFFPLSILLWVVVDLISDFWKSVFETIKGAFNGWSNTLYNKYVPRDDS